MTIDLTTTLPGGTAPATLRLPDAPAHLRATLDAGGAIAWSEAIEVQTYLPTKPST